MTDESPTTRTPEETPTTRTPTPFELAAEAARREQDFLKPIGKVLPMARLVRPFVEPVDE